MVFVCAEYNVSAYPLIPDCKNGLRVVTLNAHYQSYRVERAVMRGHDNYCTCARVSFVFSQKITCHPPSRTATISCTAVTHVVCRLVGWLSQALFA